MYLRRRAVFQFYRFPTNPEKRSKWIAAVKRDHRIPNDNTWICSTHFVTGKRSDNSGSKLRSNSVFLNLIHLQNENWRKKFFHLKEDRKQREKGFLCSQVQIGTNALLTRMIVHVLRIVVRIRKLLIVKQKYLNLKPELMLQITV